MRPADRPPSARTPTSSVIYAMRVLLVAALIATLQQTWPLWSVRETPPLLSLVGATSFAGFGWLMACTAATFIVRPRVGLALHVAVSVAAMLVDQTRMQPQLFSFWLLMLGTLASPTAQFVSRCHLASLWTFSGIHKLLSAGYFRDVAPFLWTGIFSAEERAAMPDYSCAVAAALAIVEIVMGLVAFVPRWRRATVAAAVVVHVGVIWLLHRHGNWNTSVWPWNAALALVGGALIATWQGSLRDELRRCGTWGFAAALLLFFSPLLFYVGLLDAYLSHCLYSANVPVATMIPAAPSEPAYQMNSIEGPYWKNLNVPQPPAHRNFESYFRAVAKPGDRMLVEDRRAWAAWSRWDRYLWRHTGTTIDRVNLPPAEDADEAAP